MCSSNTIWKSYGSGYQLRWFVKLFNLTAQFLLTPEMWAGSAPESPFESHRWSNPISRQAVGPFHISAPSTSGLTATQASTWTSPLLDYQFLIICLCRMKGKNELVIILITAIAQSLALPTCRNWTTDSKERPHLHSNITLHQYWSCLLIQAPG